MKKLTLLCSLTLSLLAQGTRGAEIANSITEFSGIQGQDGWQYGYLLYFPEDPVDYDPTDWIEFEADGTAVHEPDTNHWTGVAWDLSIEGGTGPWTTLQAESAHPNGENSAPGEEHWAIRRWIADDSVTDETPVAMQWHLRSTNTGGAGTAGQLHLNGVMIDKAVIAGPDQTGVTRTYYTTINEGDVIDLALTPENVDGTRADSSDGSAYWLKIDNELPKLPIQPDGTLYIPPGREGDTDSDGLIDFWELAFAENLALLATGGDADEDGVNDETEFALLLDPTDPDFDDDGDSDGAEIAGETDPKDPNSNLSVIADSKLEFSGVQGEKGWHYGYRNLADDGGDTDYETDDLIEFSEDEWTGEAWDFPEEELNETFLGPELAHPTGENTDGDEHWVIRRWVADELTEATQATVTWQVSESNAAGAGVTGSLHVNGLRIDAATIPGGDTEGVTRTVYLTIEPGDAIDLALTPVGRGDDLDDTDDLSVTRLRISRKIPELAIQENGEAFAPSDLEFVADSELEFSGEQGLDGWRYGYLVAASNTVDYTPAAFNEFGEGEEEPELWFTGSWDWPEGNPPWTQISATNTHPNGDNNGEIHWTIRRWVAEIDELQPIAIAWNVADGNAGCGNGVTGGIHLNGTRIDSDAIPGGRNTNATRIVYANVRPGDFVDFILSPQGADGGNGDGCDNSVTWMKITTFLPSDPVQPDGTPFAPVSADDSDGDDLPDAWELSWEGIDSLEMLSGAGDFDSDNLTDLDEFNRASDPTKPDTDGDGLNDNVETDTAVFVDSSDTGTSPNRSDSDGDTLSDFDEVNGEIKTNPTLKDTDGDGFDDAAELVDGTDPNDAESNRFTGLIANSIEEFSGEQGQDNWIYGYRNVTEDGGAEDAYDPVDDFIEFEEDWWTGGNWDEPNEDGDNVPWTNMSAESSHPNGDNNQEVHWTIRRWVSEVSGNIAVRWSMRKQNANCGNGVTGAIYVNGTLADSTAIAGSDSVGVNRSVTVSVSAGDFVDLVHTPMGDDGSNQDGCDGTFLSMLISPTGGGGLPFQVETITYADGAATFTWKSSPNATYTIEQATEIPEWLELDDGIESDGETTSFTDSPPAGTTQRYYRVRRE